MDHKAEGGPAHDDDNSTLGGFCRLKLLENSASFSKFLSMLSLVAFENQEDKPQKINNSKKHF